MPDRRLDSPFPQFETEVDSIPVINGATCLVTIDVTPLGNDFARRTLQATGTGATDQQLGDAIHDAIVAKIAEQCPDGQVKLELLYHFGPKPIDDSNGRTRQWQQQKSIEIALRRLGQQPVGDRIEKVYLKGCYSDGDLNLVDAAFGLRGVRYVVTVDDIIILLPPGVITGADGDYRPQPVGVTIWKKERGQQIAQRSSDRVDADERYNIHTGTVEDRDDPITGPCPTVAPLSGSYRSWVMGGSRRAVEAYIDTLTSNGMAEYIARGLAATQASSQAAERGCPNPHCQKQRIANIAVSNVRFTRIQSFWWYLVLQEHYDGYLDFDWTADMWCE